VVASSVTYDVYYSGRKLTASFGHVTVRGEKDGKGKGGAQWRSVCLSMYSITENIYYSQLSFVAILLQPEPVSHRTMQGKDWVLSPYVLSSWGSLLPPTCLLVTVNEARSYFASTITAETERKDICASLTVKCTEETGCYCPNSILKEMNTTTNISR
jgi:hypothetical protein